MNWITEHWQSIINTVVAVVAAARLIVKLTPTPKDDSALDKVVTAAKHVGLVIEPSKPAE
jgi:hypothetical protein